MFASFNVLDFSVDAVLALFNEGRVFETSWLEGVTNCCARVIFMHIGHDEGMGAELTPWQSTMNDDVTPLGSTMMACEGHVPSEKTVLSEPSMHGLASEVSVRFS